MANQVSSSYIPGICNINTEEQASRRRSGYAGLVVTVSGWLLVSSLPISPYWRLILLAPLFLTALAFLQAQQHFCVSFAAAGVERAADRQVKRRKVTSAAAHAADNRRARRLYVQALAISLPITALTLLLPRI